MESINILDRAPNEVKTLMNACRSAASQDALAAALNDVAVAIPKLNDSDRDDIAFLLIRDVVVLGGTPSKSLMALDTCLKACSPYAALGACSRFFLDAARIKLESPNVLETALHTVKRLFLMLPKGTNENTSMWLRHIDYSDTNMSERARGVMQKAQMESIVTIVLSVPSQIANACHHQKLMLPSWCVRTRYLARAIECAFAMINPSKGSQLYIQTLIQKIVHSGGSDEVAVGMYRYYQQFQPDWFQAVVLDCMREIATPRECATLVRSILRHLIARDQGDTQDLHDIYEKVLLPYLELVCRPILETCPDVCDSFVQLTILSPSIQKPDPVVGLCVSKILAACLVLEDESSDEEDDDCCSHRRAPVLWRHANNVSSFWSQVVFVQNTDLNSQRHVTLFLLASIPILICGSQDAATKLVESLLSGVSARLSSSLLDARKDGMRVAELLAKQMNQELKFDELDGERETRGGLRAESATAEKSITEEPAKAYKTKKRTSCNRVVQSVDPGADHISDDDQNSKVFSDSTDENNGTSATDDGYSVWDNDEALRPYNLDDDEEDLRDTPSPLYLRECLNMLRTPDTEELACSRQEAALDAVSPLVRSNPVDLPDMTGALCEQLLHMENKFDLPDFVEQTEAGLVSLCVLQPVLAGEQLTTDFFRDGCSLQTRLSVLHTLESAAYELCGAKTLEKGRQCRNATRSPPKQKVSGKRRLVADYSTSEDDIQVRMDRATVSIESRTRRWGRCNRQAKALTVVNSFVSVAPSWFYSLVGGFVEHKDDTALWGGANGARLLASFLVTLSTILECSGPGVGMELLAKDLIELAWTFRAVEVPEVRTAVLVAIANSLVVMSEDALISVLYGHDNDLADFLRATALDDSNGTNRAIASSLASSMSQILGGIRSTKSIQ